MKNNFADDISGGEGLKHNEHEKYRVEAAIPLDLVDVFSQIPKEDNGTRILSRQFPGLIDF